MINRMIKWLIFSVLIALLPILFNLLFAMTYGGEIALTRLLGRGELLLIAVGLCATALGDVLFANGSFTRSRPRLWRALRLVVGGACVLVIAASSFYYALASERYSQGLQAREEAVLVISSICYATAVICSGISVWLTERSRRG